MAGLLDIFKRKPSIERPPIGRLVYDQNGWETRTPPPPLDSRGLLQFDADRSGPTEAQFAAYEEAILSYAAWLPAIHDALFAQYKQLDDGWNLLPAASAASISSVTRLTGLFVDGDCSVCLSYDLFLYYGAGQCVERSDHNLNVRMRNGVIADVTFDG